ncbi:MAG: hypothetical protein Q9222_002433 [Ikaeria aurantiellina]
MALHGQHPGSRAEFGVDNRYSQQSWSNKDDAQGLTSLLQECHALRARNAMLEDHCNRVSQEKRQLKHGAEESAARCEAFEKELGLRTDQLRIANEQLSRSERNFRSATEDLEKARKTIAIQSRAIQGHRDVAPPRTNNKFAHQPPPLNERYGVDCGFGLKAVATTAPDPRESLYPPSQFEEQASTVPSRSQRLLQSYSDDVRRQSFHDSRALISHYQPEKREKQWTSTFSLFFASVQSFCCEFLNVPNEQTDGKWPARLAPGIAKESSVEHITHLAQHKDTRYLLLTRVIIAWIEARCFHARIIKKYSSEYDSKMQEIRRQKGNPKSSLEFRRGLAQAQVNLVEEIIKQPQFEEWRAKRIREDVETMMEHLHPTIIPGTFLAPLGNTFQAILSDAWQLGLKMMTTTSTFGITFFAANEHFDSRSMINRSPYLKETPKELEDRRARIALAITPHITITDIMGKEEESRPIHMADVLLRT